MTGRGLRIGLVYDDSPERYGGVGQYCITLGKELVARGHDVQLLVGETSATSIEGLRVFSLARNITVRFNGNTLTVPLKASSAELARVATTPFDVLHVQMPYSPLLGGQIVRAAHDGCAVVGTFHVASDRLSARAGARLLARWTRFTDRRFDEVMAVSEPARTFATRNFVLPKVTVVPNMTEVPSNARPMPCNPTPVVAFVGRLERRKGVVELLRDFPAVLEQHPKATLLVLGDGSLRARLQTDVRRLGLSNQVEFLGAVSPHVRDMLLETADVACFPSLFGESFGIVLIEAMSAGAGVAVGGENPGHRETLRHREESIADPRTAGGIAVTINRLLGNYTLRERLHAEQQALVRRFATGSVVDEIEVVYARAMASRRRHDLRRSPVGVERTGAP